MERLEAIKARLAAATPWPWEVRRDPDGNDCVYAPVGGPDRGWWIAEPTPHACGAEGDDKDRTPANAELMAHAPADLDWLVAEVERLRTDAAMHAPHTPAGAGEVPDGCVHVEAVEGAYAKPEVGNE